jgi:hypothetical protein
MNLREVLPIAGVAIGWFLKEVSDRLRHRFTERGDLGVALVGLLRLDAELYRLSTFLEFQKSRPISWGEYEKIRKDTAERYLIRTDPAEAIDAAARELARYDPVQATILRDVPFLLRQFHRTDLAQMDTNSESYVAWLSSIETTVQIAEIIIRKLTARLARHHGWMTWVRVRLMWRRRKSDSARKNREFAQAMISSLYGEESGDLPWWKRPV